MLCIFILLDTISVDIDKVMFNLPSEKQAEDDTLTQEDILKIIEPEKSENDNTEEKDIHTRMKEIDSLLEDILGSDYKSDKK